MVKHISSSPEETKEIAAQQAKRMPHGGFTCLYGDLGSGKTVFVKGFAGQLGLKEMEIKSPTYTFVRQYKIGTKNLFHFDFYRIEALDDLMIHDLEEILMQKNTWIIIEWAERVQKILPTVRTDVHFRYIDDHTRDITITEHE